MAAMPRRPLGGTGLHVSLLGFGASPLGSVFESIDEEEGVRAVHEAVRCGINFFDVSPFYGDTRAESVLGRALKTLPRDQESMARLNVDYIDVIQCHDVEFVPLDMVVSEALPALLRLKAAGKVGHIGITGLPLPHLQRVLLAAPPGSVDVVLSYCKLTLADRSLLGCADALRTLGQPGAGGRRGCINASPLSMGLLTERGPPPWHPAPPELRAAAAAAAAALGPFPGLTLGRLALQWAVRHPEVDTTLVGMATCAEVRANAEAVAEALQPGWEEAHAAALQAVHASLAGVQHVSWPSGLHESNKP